jgi:hypothetical protein
VLITNYIGWTAFCEGCISLEKVFPHNLKFHPLLCMMCNWIYYSPYLQNYPFLLFSHFPQKLHIREFYPWYKGHTLLQHPELMTNTSLWKDNRIQLYTVIFSILIILIIMKI